MRKLLALIALLIAALLAGQSVMAAGATYSECCGDACEGMAQCASSACLICAAPLALTQTPAPAPAPRAASSPAAHDEFLPPAPLAEIWNPPD